MSEELRTHLERIESNWYNRRGQCADCPHWPTGGFESPFYGANKEDKLDAQVVFVGAEPGTGGDEAFPEWRDEEEITIEEAENRISKLDWEVTDFPYSNCAMFPTEELLDIAVGKKSGNSPDFDYYLTNIKKCQESYDRDEKYIEEDADYVKSSDCCSEYFETEIDIIQPQLVVTLGKKTTREVFRCYDSLPSKSYTPSLTKSFFPVYDSDNWKLIPAMHPSDNNLNTNNSFEDVDMFDSIVSSLDEEGLTAERSDIRGEPARRAYFNLLRKRIQNEIL